MSELCNCWILFWVQFFRFLYKGSPHVCVSGFQLYERAEWVWRCRLNCQDYGLDSLITLNRLGLRVNLCAPLHQITSDSVNYIHGRSLSRSQPDWDRLRSRQLAHCAHLKVRCYTTRSARVCVRLISSPIAAGANVIPTQRQFQLWTFCV
jgi:hypothetical protein